MADQRKTLFWNETGPLVQYADGTLYIEDLNPQVATKWRMSRSEMVLFGLRTIFAGIFHSDPAWNREVKRMRRAS